MYTHSGIVVVVMLGSLTVSFLLGESLALSVVAVVDATMVIPSEEDSRSFSGSVGILWDPQVWPGWTVTPHLDTLLQP
jgi:hypothetical protein